MTRARIRFSDLAVSDILEQADWYEEQAGAMLAQRWETAVTATLWRIALRPSAGSRCRFKAEQLRDTRRVAVDGFPRHLVFYQAEPQGIVVLRIVHVRPRSGKFVLPVMRFIKHSLVGDHAHSTRSSKEGKAWGTHIHLRATRTPPKIVHDWDVPGGPPADSPPLRDQPLLGTEDL